MKDKGNKQQSELWKDQRIAELEKELRKTEEERIVAIELSKTFQHMLIEINDELGSLLASAETGAMFLNTKLCIKSATLGMQKHFNIIPGDMGRPVTQLVSNLQYDALEQDVKQVMATSVLKEIVIQSKDDQWFSMRILPHSKANDVIDGVMITLTDITNLKKIEDKLRESGTKLLDAIKKSPVVVWNQDIDLRYTWIHNPHPGFKQEEIIGKTDEELLPSRDAANLAKIKLTVLTTGVGVREKVKTTIEGKPYYYDLTVEPLLDSNSNIIGISCTSMEISKTLYEQQKPKR